MALGMSRAVFSFVMEQMSLSRTVSCRPRGACLNIVHIQGSRCADAAYQRFPAEDVAVKADPVLREVESPLQEDVPLKSAGVVCSNRELDPQHRHVSGNVHSSYTSMSYIMSPLVRRHAKEEDRLPNEAVGGSYWAPAHSAGILPSGGPPVPVLTGLKPDGSHSPTMSLSVSGSCLKSFLKSSLRCLYVGLSTCMDAHSQNHTRACTCTCTHMHTRTHPPCSVSRSVRAASVWVTG